MTLPAYAVAHLRTVDVGPAIADYLARIDATLAPFDGRFLIHGARVYVMGAGLIGDDAKGAYRSGKVLQSLERFWQGYFERSNATLVSFGTPELTTDLK